MIGNLWFASITTAGAWGRQKIDLGIAVLDRDAVAASAFPDPNAQDDRPPTGWVYRSSVGAQQNGSGAPILTNERFDLRAQRKLAGGQLTLVVNNTSLGGTSFTVDISGIIRVLLLLP